MPRLHFPDQALVIRLVEAAVKGGKPLMLAHDHGLYLCHDDIKHEPPGTGCVCAFVDGCDPDIDEEAHETANALVGFDDFGIALPLCGEQSLLDDLRNGHRLAIAFGRRAVTIVTQAPPTKPQPTPAARGRGAESPPTARSTERTTDMTSKKAKSTKTAPKNAKAKASGSGEKLRRAAIAEIGERIATLDGDKAPAKASAPAVTSATTAATGAKAETGGTAQASKTKAATKAKPANESKPKRVSALDAAATVLANAKEPMSAGDLIDAMAKRDLWKSPGGKTPNATLYAAIVREIGKKGRDARFKKTDRGLFVANNGKAA